MQADPFDVVVVADFSEPVARRFEIMTLFFLASWLEFGGQSRGLPLHIVCIGQPPDSVRSLGSRCNASITSHEPYLFGGFANKLRGFEVKRKTEHVLLLDSDMLVLSEIHNLSRDIGDNCIAAAAANGPIIVPRNQILPIYEMLNIPSPDKYVIPLNLQLDTFQCEPYKGWDKNYFYPYYNGGIVYAPWRCELGKVWLDHLRQISKITKQRAKISNQPSLATAIAYLQLQGFDFQLLPDEYHVRWQHIATGAVSSHNTRLLHTIGFGRWSAKGNCNTAKQEIDIYLSNTLDLTQKVYSHHPADHEAAQNTQHKQIEDCHRVYRLLKGLYDKYVCELKK